MATQFSPKQQRQFLCQWTLVNGVGTIAASFAALFLYSHLWLSRYGNGPTDWVNLVRGLALCGITQGLALASLQTLLLLWGKVATIQKASQWFFATIACMGVGMALPTYYAFFMSPPEPLIATLQDVRIVGLVLSWTLAGLAWGAIAASHPMQKIRWGLLNAGAYSLWSIAAIVGWFFLIAALDDIPGDSTPSFTLAQWVKTFLFVTVTWSLGSGLNGWIFHRVLRSGLRYRQHPENRGED
jgi:hypothetical protein